MQGQVAEERSDTREQDSPLNEPELVVEANNISQIKEQLGVINK